MTKKKSADLGDLNYLWMTQAWILPILGQFFEKKKEMYVSRICKKVIGADAGP